MSKSALSAVTVFLVSSIGISVAAAPAPPPDRCRNPEGQTFHPAPVFMAPDETRGTGVLVNLGGQLQPLPDLRAGCMPLSLRLNNPGALKTRGSGPWNGQTARDRKGHAVFATLTDGVAAWVTWIRARTASNPQVTAFQMMSMYAPPDDCVGSVDKLPNGQCPRGYPLNPTRAYATRVAAAVHKGPDDPLVLDPTDCRDHRESLFAVFREVMTFEAGRGFCGGESCSIDRAIFEAGADRAAGRINDGPCADPSNAHERRE